jgi:CBS domain-containing protein
MLVSRRSALVRYSQNPALEETIMNVDAVMTKDLVSCRTTDSLTRAAQLMWERRCGCLPVLDETQRVVGVLTDRDISMAAYTQGRRLDDIAASIAMSRSVESCSPSTSIEEAEDLMMAYAIHRLMVIDSDGRLCGLVSLDDIARQAAAWDRKGEIDLERVALTLAEISRCNGSADEDKPATASPQTDHSLLVQNSLAALETLRDEIRVDLHLAGKELRDRWRRLEAQLRAAETRARSARRSGERRLASLLEGARQLRSRIQERPST